MEEARDGEFVSLNDAYIHYLTIALNTKWPLTDEAIKSINLNICKNLSDINTSNCEIIWDQIRSTEIINSAKKKQSEKFAFKTSQSKTYGRYNFAIEDNCTVISGENNTSVLMRIRSWLCDFGDCNNKFDISLWGYHQEMEKGLDLVKEALKVTSLMKTILKKPLSVGTIWEPDNLVGALWRTTNYVQVQPIQVEFWFHEPSSVKGDVKITNENINITVNGETLSASIPHISIPNLDVEFDGELEYTVKKGVYVKTWGILCTFGLITLFNSEKTVKMVHKVKMKMNCKAEKIKKRDKIQIEISRKSAENFLKVFQTYESMEKSEHRKRRELLALEDVQVLVDWGKQWRRCIYLLRIGDEKAIKEMVEKKPLVIENLPADLNNLAGIAFEELQIQSILENAKKRGFDLEYIAGDGRGEFVFNGNQVKTPEYVDAVFRNKTNENMYAVQFKYADKAEHLKSMGLDWENRHINRQPAQGEVPEELLLENVQLIGPTDVVDQLKPGGRFKRQIDVGFKQTPLQRQDVKCYLETFQRTLKTIVRDNKSKQLSDMKTAIKKEENALDKQLKKLQQIKNTRQKEKYGEIVKRSEEKYKLNFQKVEVAEIRYQNFIRKQMSKGVRHSALKQLGISVLLGGISDGIISFVIARDTEKNNRDVALKTIFGFFRGGGISAAVCAPDIIGTLAGYAGYHTAETALSTVGKLAGPAFIVGMSVYSFYTIYKKWRDDEVTEAEAKKAIVRQIISSGVSIPGMILAGSLIGGPLGLLVGSLVAIGVGIGDYFLGDKVASLFVTDDPDEKDALVKRKQKKALDDVLDAAYKLFDSSEHESYDELLAIFRRAKLTYHPDKHFQDKNKKEHEEILFAVMQAKNVIISHLKAEANEQ